MGEYRGEDLRRVSKFSIDLGLFGKAEDEGRTEEPTIYKEKKAREEGKVVRSQELVSALVLLGSLLSLWFFSKYMFGRLKSIFEKSFSYFTTPITEGNLWLYLEGSFWDMGEILLPIFATVTLVGVLGNLLQVGFKITPKSLKVDFKRLNFISNKMFGKIFFSRQAVVNLIKSLLKVVVIFVITYSFMSWKRDNVLDVIDMEVMAGLEVLLEIGFYVGVVSCLCFLVLSIPDYFFQKLEYKESLKMTRHEMKEERKEMDGDPYMRQRLKDRQKEILRVRMVEEVSGADIVITNPTHFAVALKYDGEEMRAPVVVAKGQNYLALRIKELAKEHGVSSVEDRVLAQTLYLSVEIGDEIPEDLYQAVAEVLAYVLRAKQRMRG